MVEYSQPVKPFLHRRAQSTSSETYTQTNLSSNRRKDNHKPCNCKDKQNRDLRDANTAHRIRQSVLPCDDLRSPCPGSLRPYQLLDVVVAPRDCNARDTTSRFPLRNVRQVPASSLHDMDLCHEPCLTRTLAVGVSRLSRSLALMCQCSTLTFGRETVYIHITPSLGQNICLLLEHRHSSQILVSSSASPRKAFSSQPCCRGFAIGEDGDRFQLSKAVQRSLALGHPMHPCLQVFQEAMR